MSKFQKMAGRILEIKDELDKSLHDKSKPWTPFLDTVEKKSGVNRSFIFVGIIAAIGLWLIFGYAAQLVCNMVVFVYPAYMSIHALESPKKDDDTKLLTFWVVFAVFSILEYFADIIVGWFPLYWLVKCIFLVWLMIPSEFNGSMIIYRNLIRPYFLAHHDKIDRVIESFSNTGSFMKNE